jgi:hypothetical protein
MGMGIIGASVLQDIANAIRAQIGTAQKYKPDEMADAVASLDGTSQGNATSYEEQSGVGVISEQVFSNIASAIRSQNGFTASYKPTEMAPAILALVWDSGLKARALLLEDYSMEFNYFDGRQTSSGKKILAAWEVPAEGFFDAISRGWDDVKTSVKSVAIDESFSASGVTSCAYWFTGFSNLKEVSGLQNLVGITSIKQMFSSCELLESLYATSFDNSKITSASVAFYGCTRLVGGTDGFVPTSSSGASVMKLGAGGMLTNPAEDGRTWLHAALFDDDELDISLSEPAAGGRTVVAEGHFCANACYNAIQCNPWASQSKQIARIVIDESVSGLSSVNTNYWFYGCSALTDVVGLSHLSGIRRMEHTFNSCTSLETLDLRGVDPSSLEKLTYTFAGCSSLTTILVDATWTLPSGCSGMGTFYSDKALVGGNGTTFSSSAVGYARCVVDAPGTPGYLTAG